MSPITHSASIRLPGVGCIQPIGKKEEYNHIGPVDVVLIIGPDCADSIPYYLNKQKEKNKEGLKMHILGDGKRDVALREIEELHRNGVIGPNTSIIVETHGGAADARHHEITLSKKSDVTIARLLDILLPESVFDRSDNAYHGIVLIGACQAGYAFDAINERNFKKNATVVTAGDYGLSDGAYERKLGGALIDAIGRMKRADDEYGPIDPRNKVRGILKYMRCLSPHGMIIIDNYLKCNSLDKPVPDNQDVKSFCKYTVEHLLFDEAISYYERSKDAFYEEFRWRPDDKIIHDGIRTATYFTSIKHGEGRELVRVADKDLPPREREKWRSSAMQLIPESSIFNENFMFYGEKTPPEEAVIKAKKYIDFITNFCEEANISILTEQFLPWMSETCYHHSNILGVAIKKGNGYIVAAVLDLVGKDGKKLFDPLKNNAFGHSALEKALEIGNFEAVIQIIQRYPKALTPTIFKKFCTFATPQELKEFLDLREAQEVFVSTDDDVEIRLRPPVKAVVKLLTRQDVLTKMVRAAVKARNWKKLKQILELIEKPEAIVLPGGQTLLHGIVRAFSTSSTIAFDAERDLVELFEKPAYRNLIKKDDKGRMPLDCCNPELFPHLHTRLKNAFEWEAQGRAYLGLAVEVGDFEQVNALLKLYPWATTKELFKEFCKRAPISELFKFMDVSDGKIRNHFLICDEQLLLEGAAEACKARQAHNLLRLLYHIKEPQTAYLEGGQTLLHLIVQVLSDPAMPSVRDPRPADVSLTGFIDEPRYRALMKKADDEGRLPIDCIHPECNEKLRGELMKSWSFYMNLKNDNS